MRSNASIVAALLLLAGCAGGGHYSDYGMAPGLSPAAQALPGYDGARRQRGDGNGQPQLSYDGQMAGGQDANPQLSGGYDRPDPAYDGPGASYAPPGQQVPQSYPQPDTPPDPYPAPARQQAYQPPAQSYAPPPQDYADPAANASGPSGSSQRGADDQRYDEVGYASVGAASGGGADGMIAALSNALPRGSYAEITALDTGRTILVMIAGPLRAGNGVADLSPGAAQALGANGGQLPVRVRKVTPPPPDMTALRAGQPASERPDTPPVLLTALRRKLTGAGGYSPQPAYGAQAPAPRPPVSRGPAPARPAPAPAARGGHYYVQAGAFSANARAQAVASSVGGFVRPGGGLFRVQIGPFRTPAEANAARARAAQRGFPDARVFTQ